MYEDIVAAARRSSEAAVRESQERVDMATTKSAEADRQATEATKAVGERWVNRINAMRRRAQDRKATPEMRFGQDDPPTDGDELVSLSEAKTADPDAQTPPFGMPEDQVAPVQPAPRPSWFMPPDEDQAPPVVRRQPRHRVDDDDDYSSQSWLQDG
ncbi:MAG TPA: hypothetical protein VEO01_30195 [Pseudonocardiaceae bacterium]|nr:hypothetical protein [Pseudonocardiaceae bacterium]